MKYRLGLDMGATSIGWCVVQLDDNDRPREVDDMGVRIFSDGRTAKDKKPLSVNRREKRSARRRRDRFVLRRNDLIRALINHGLMPKDKAARKALEHKNPWEARAKAIRGKVDLYTLGRALFHINQRRGFKSNRIVELQEDDQELKGMKEGIRLLRQQLDGKTLGEYLYARHQQRKTVRMRPREENANRNEWDFYADRVMYLDEFERISSKQKTYHPELTDQVIAELREIIFRQRELRQSEPGWCALLPNEKRMLSALPLFQRFRILQEVNNLEIVDYGEQLEPIDQNGRRRLLEVLTRSFDGVTKQDYLGWAKIWRLLGYKGRIEFNLMRVGNKGIFCDRTSRLLSDEERFGKAWFELTADQQSAIVQKLLHETSREDLRLWLNQQFTLTEPQLDSICNTRLQKGYGRLSQAAVSRLIPHLEKGMTYDKACALEGIDHSDQHSGEIYARGDLPYYGEVMPRHTLGGNHDLDKANDPEGYFGKINNPSVHIALNQLRLIINTLYKRYGTAPQEIYIELARELKLSQKRLTEIEREQRANREHNQKIDEILAKLGVAVNYNNRMRYRLWEDLAPEPDRRVCPFSGKPIPLSELFTERFEVEHLLPFSRSFDDRRSNKVICTRTANRDKANHTPFEAFGHSPAAYRWSEILARAENLPGNKRWRFEADAMEKIKGQQDDVIARLLTDTQYMSRIAREYMTYVLADHARVVTPTGQLTAKLRHHWGLNSLLSKDDVKERGDHRHHAIDAFVVACSSRSIINKVNRAASRAEEENLEAAIKGMAPPMPDFDRQRIAQLVEKMVISHRPDNSSPLRAMKENRTKNQLHKETNWGLIGPSEREGYSIFATRVPLLSLDNKEKTVEEIADSRIRHDLLNEVRQEYSKSQWKKFLTKYGKQNNIRHVRIHREKANAGMIPITDHQGKAYRYVQGGENFCMDIWCDDKGSLAGKWQACPVSMFEAHTALHPPWRHGKPTAWRVMRLHKNDTVAYDNDGERVLARVKKINTGGHVVVRDLRIAKEDGDRLSWKASANQLQIKNARRVWVDPLGRVHDAGKARKA